MAWDHAAAEVVLLVTNYDRYLAKQMQDWRFRFWYRLFGVCPALARPRMWLWRVMHRREAERLDRYVGER